MILSLNIVNPPVYPSLPLASLLAGQIAHVEEILGLAEHVHRLQELGLRPGVQIEMVEAGSPCIIRLGGQKLCFRADDATSVLVRGGALA